MITMEQYWMGRDRDWPPSDQILANVQVLVERVNRLIPHIPAHVMTVWLVSSGYRPAEINARTKGAAKASKHMTGQAVDLSDPGGKLAGWLLEHTAELVSAALWMEHPRDTPTWCHLQSAPPRSGNRVFYAR